MNFFGIGLPEMILIMVVALLIFGPKKLPEIGRSVGKAVKGFQDASNEFQAEFKREAELLEQVKAIPNNIMNPAALFADKDTDLFTDAVNDAAIAENIVPENAPIEPAPNIDQAIDPVESNSDDAEVPAIATSTNNDQTV